MLHVTWSVLDFHYYSIITIVNSITAVVSTLLRCFQTVLGLTFDTNSRIEDTP